MHYVFLNLEWATHTIYLVGKKRGRGGWMGIENHLMYCKDQKKHYPLRLRSRYEIHMYSLTVSLLLYTYLPHWHDFPLTHPWYTQTATLTCFTIPLWPSIPLPFIYTYENIIKNVCISYYCVLSIYYFFFIIIIVPQIFLFLCAVKIFDQLWWW